MSSDGRPVAWEDGSVSFPANLALTWWECLVSPDRFFRRVYWRGSFSRPLLYFLIVAVVAGMLGLFWFAWGPWESAGRFSVTLEVELLSFFLTPFALLLGLGVVASLQHLFVFLLAPERRGIGSTATVLCYASGVGLVTAIVPPALGWFGPAPGGPGPIYLGAYVTLALATQVWYVVVNVTGLRRAHSTTTGRAAAIVLLPIAIGLVLAGVFLMIALALVTMAELPV